MCIAAIEYGASQVSPAPVFAHSAHLSPIVNLQIVPFQSNLLFFQRSLIEPWIASEKVQKLESGKVFEQMRIVHVEIAVANETLQVLETLDLFVVVEAGELSDFLVVRGEIERRADEVKGKLTEIRAV